MRTNKISNLNLASHVSRLGSRMKDTLSVADRSRPATLLKGLLLGLAIAVSVPAFAPSPVFAAEKASRDKIVINFVDVDIATVANFISKLTGKNFIYDENFSGKVTIVAPSKMDPEEAFDLFMSVLKLKGYTSFYTGTAYKIVPSSEIKQGPVDVVGDKSFRVNEAYVARIIPLSFVQGQDLLPVLQPLLSKEGYISTFGKGNNLLVVDNALNIEKILKITSLLDAKTAAYAAEMVYLKHAQADSVAQILKQVRSSVRGRVQEVSAASDKRLNALVLFGTHEENREIKELIAVMDVPSPEAASKINIYNLENADSTELAKVLDGLLRPGGPGAPPAPGAADPNRVAITPYKESNSLIIMASQEEYQNVVQVIKKLDRRPKQVFVEAMITEVSINKSLELGTKWRGAATKDGRPVVIGGVGTINSGAMSDILSGMSGFTAGGMANFLNVPVLKPDGTVTELTIPGFAALFSLSEFKDAVDVLSTPHILTSDNKEAEIVVGENVPFLSKLEREGTTVNQPVLQSIERKDVGITLRIKPQISEGDYIKLDIYQEISALSPSAVNAADIITTKRSAKTSVVVRDRQTVVIGGLIQDKELKNTTRVPLLSDIPLLGWLFKSTSTGKQKTNLLVYLTPRIVKDLGSLDEIREKKTGDYERGITDGEKKE